MRKKIQLFSGGVLGITLGLVIATTVTKHNASKKIDRWKAMSNKHFELFLLMNQWVRIKQEGKMIASYLAELNIEKIAIYGMSYVGERLVNELKETQVQVLYGIDKNAKGLYSNLEIVTLDDSFREVDAIVVTAVTHFDEIKETLCRKISCRIISLEDLLYEV